MRSFRFAVAGNLLLAGEYMILEEGGRGAALAVEPRLVVTVTPSSEGEIQGLWPGGGERWRPGLAPNFAGRVWESLLKRQRRGVTSIPTVTIQLDSSAFFDESGRKLGFGSSAAVAVGLTAALTRLAGLPIDEVSQQWAVEAHREAQGGRGSGYDVVTSWNGGWGEFTGGACPTWRPCPFDALPALAWFSGPERVSTVSAIDAFQTWKRDHQTEASATRQASDRAVRALTSARAPHEFLAAFHACRDIGRELGRSIGQPAHLDLPSGTAGFPSTHLVKALGAGDETGLVAFGEPPSPFPDSVHPLRPAREGILWDD